MRLLQSCTAPLSIATKTFTSGGIRNPQRGLSPCVMNDSQEVSFLTCLTRGVQLCKRVLKHSEFRNSEWRIFELPEGSY
jgi:hypothetical protein